MSDFVLCYAGVPDCWRVKPEDVPRRLIYQATLETRNFFFTAFGETHNAALMTLTGGLEAHGQQYKCADGWYLPFTDDIVITSVEVGHCYRDNERLI